MNLILFMLCLEERRVIFTFLSFKNLLLIKSHMKIVNLSKNTLWNLSAKIKHICFSFNSLIDDDFCAHTKNWSLHAWNKVCEANISLPHVGCQSGSSWSSVIMEIIHNSCECSLVHHITPNVYCIYIWVIQTYGQCSEHRMEYVMWNAVIWQ